MIPDHSTRGANTHGPNSNPGLLERTRRFLLGPPRDLNDRSLFRRISLIPLLAWIGLGSDGLSSSCYGPEEAFRALGQHSYLAIAIATATTFTVVIISIAYSRVIEHFPSGGGGYVVAHKLLGENAGVVSGCALFVDYILTITVSIASAGDALLSMLPLEFQRWKIFVEFAMILMLLVLNLRGVKESVLALTPIFVIFIVTHVLLIMTGLLLKAPEIHATAANVRSGFSGGFSALGGAGLLMLAVRGYSLGGGTYTGIEAVSNGLPILREPRVANGKRTMLYMAASLSFTASGLLLCYLLWDLHPAPGKTLNALLAQRLASGVPLGGVLVAVTLLAEGALLVVGAQTGFVDGPRVLANMALDSWMPRRFSALSDRLTMRNGILIMGILSLVVLLYTRGDVRQIVVMYSINVFLTFSITEFAMCHFWLGERTHRGDWLRKILIHVAGLVLCLTILLFTVFEKFREGGWITLAVTGLLVILCHLIHRHYLYVGRKLYRLYQELVAAAESGAPAPLRGRFDPSQPTAVVLVASYSGVGIHTMLNAFRMIPDHFQNLVFVSVGVVDSGGFKGEKSLQALRAQTGKTLKKYTGLADRLGVPSTARYAIGTDAIDETEKLCLQIMKEFPQATFFAGKIVLTGNRWAEAILHNQSAFAIQKRLEVHGVPMIIIPALVQ